MAEFIGTIVGTCFFGYVLITILTTTYTAISKTVTTVNNIHKAFKN